MKTLTQINHDNEAAIIREYKARLARLNELQGIAGDPLTTVHDGQPLGVLKARIKGYEALLSRRLSIQGDPNPNLVNVKRGG